MSVMSVRVDEEQRKLLKAIASVEGKTISGLVGDLIEEYVRKNRDKLIREAGESDLAGIMKMSEAAFAGWDNDEDAVYDSL